ncbi:S1C family serine protease [soil metagenome]
MQLRFSPGAVLAAFLVSFTASVGAQKKPAPAASPAQPVNVVPAAVPAVKPKELSLVRVNVTGQAYDYTRPWQKKAPFSKRALGAVLPKNRVLVTADLVANQNYVELERAESGEKSGADVVVVDYEANLALVEPSDKKFLDGLAPLQLALDTVVGDRLAALQLESTGALVVTEGLVTTVQMTRYPAEVSQFLTYRISMSMQYRDNSYTIPLVKKNKLAGLLLRYDPRSQVLDAIPAPIIAHFLKEADSEHYRGFPTAGFSFFPTRDPQLRQFAGQTGKPAGVYVTSLEPNMPAAKAGMQVGDIVTAVSNNDLDQNGNYVDPLYGKIEFTNLITARAFVGDTLPVQVQRAGKTMQLDLVLEHRTASDYVIPPYTGDQPPSFYVLGGLVFQELSRQYLREWGPTWLKDAPQRFVYMDRFQSELFPEGNRRVVVLSQVLQANSTIGYDEYGFLTVDKVNGKEIRSLRDLAEAARQPVDKFIVIETQEDPKQLQLDAAQVAEEALSLKENYGLPALERLE